MIGRLIWNFLIALCMFSLSIGLITSLIEIIYLPSVSIANKTSPWIALESTEFSKDQVVDNYASLCADCYISCSSRETTATKYLCGGQILDLDFSFFYSIGKRHLEHEILNQFSSNFPY